MSDALTTPVWSQRSFAGRVLAAAMMLAAAACTDSSGPGGGHANHLPALLLSGPVSVPARRVSGTPPVAASGGGPIVYVSLPPGAVPNGVSATISDGSTRDSVVIPVIDGGFDPVAIAANTGDTIDVVIGLGPGTSPVTGFAVVAAFRAPHVVRTSPPRGRADVPLNASIIAVFSSPVDSASIDATTLSLELGGRPVSGVARLSDSTGLRAQFVPDSWLAKSTTYTIVVTRGVRDVNGIALDSAVSATFTTSDVAAAGGSLQIGIAPPGDGIPAQVDVSGPLPAGGFFRTIAASQTISGLAPGQYSITAHSVSNGSVGYLGEPAADTVTVTAGSTSLAAITYAQGRLMNLIITGLPAGLHTYVGVYLQTPHQFVTAYGGGNGSYAFPVFPGSYDIEAPTVISYADSSVYGFWPNYIEDTVRAGVTVVNERLNYGKLTGKLAVTVSGLPAGVSPRVNVIGDYWSIPQTITQSGTTSLGAVAIGGYMACADTVIVGSTTYIGTEPDGTCESLVHVGPGADDTLNIIYYVP